MEAKVEEITDENDVVVASLQPLNFHLIEADKTKAPFVPGMIDDTTFSRNTRFLNSNYMGEIAQFIDPWKKDKPLSLEAESKTDNVDSKDSKADSKAESKVDSKSESKESVDGIEIPDTLVYVEVVPELSAKAKRKLAISKLSDEKPGLSSSDSDSDDKITSSGRRKSRREGGERKSIRFSMDYEDDRRSDRDIYYNSDSKSDRNYSDSKDDAFK